ncbi:isoprenyl transferase [Cytophagaceae bacterium DM2B3-1]|uniref:Isoprenyl transferase n=1 Tax=Xanthocytophaga flava TaxID=3048013 RepID=A0ABT7CKI6_9BACT|nr:isoprenyl transferase [Xanthocytophaga flavus]MDJ1469756.1 isoprenyl transferase [Xanthocytophaga flavus]MDJ1494268.1 isoprenyl transferase [Xanthocytophaga flavus]
MKEKINTEKLPLHIAVIMDGNGRWAKKQGAMRVFGHRNAVKAVRDTTEACAELGIKYLTLYAFSTENWSRPQAEVNALMELLVSTIRSETETLMKNNVRLLAIGDIQNLPKNCQKELAEAIEITSKNTGLSLVLALSYSGRWEITEAIKQISTKVASGELSVNEITDQVISQHLTTKNIPDPELLIRTSGEMRISNFLLWQIAYTEIFICDTLWPDFRREHLYEAILAYQQRERRFGKISEQVNA